MNLQVIFSKHLKIRHQTVSFLQVLMKDKEVRGLNNKISILKIKTF